MPSETPDHWSFVGKGDHRLVYRAPTGEVYKVGRDRINRREHGVLQILAADPETVAFVPVYAFYDFSTAFDLTGWSMGETVVAMEFVEDDGTEPDDHDLTILINRLEHSRFAITTRTGEFAMVGPSSSTVAVSELQVE